MNKKTFVDLCAGTGKNMKQKKTKDGGVTHPIENYTHPKIGFPGYCMGDDGRVGGPNNGGNDMGSPVGAPAGDGLGGGGSACESIDPKTFGACLEAIEEEYPTSEVAKQINNMFKQMMAGNTVAPLYHGADGCESDDDSDKPDSQCSTETEELISAAAAACESSLALFKRLTGFDYCQFRKK